MRKVKAIDCVTSVQSHINKGRDCAVLDNRTHANFIVRYATFQVSERSPTATKITTRTNDETVGFRTTTFPKTIKKQPTIFCVERNHLYIYCEMSLA